MKYLLLLLSVFLFSFDAKQTTDQIGVKGPLTFNNTIFSLSWSHKQSETYILQEYLPAGEKTETYNQMLTLHLFDTDISVADAVGQKVKELNERKKTDAVCQFAALKGPEGKEYVVDFLLSDSKAGKLDIVEFNIYRYFIVNTGKGNALLVYAYTKRSYGEKINSFLKELASTRKSMINEMAQAKVPKLSLKN